MRIKANKAMVINDDGTPISIPHNGSAEVSDTIGDEMIDAGLATEYVEVSPEGQLTVNRNGVYDCFEYAEVSVNAGGGKTSIAEVTISVTGGTAEFAIPRIINVGGNDGMIVDGVFDSSESPFVVNVPVYDTGVLINLPNDAVVNASGDIQILETPYGNCAITGNGEITITYGGNNAESQ